MNQSHNCADSEADHVLHSYIQELSSKENFSNKGGEGASGGPITTMQVPSPEKCRCEDGFLSLEGGEGTVPCPKCNRYCSVKFDSYTDPANFRAVSRPEYGLTAKDVAEVRRKPLYLQRYRAELAKGRNVNDADDAALKCFESVQGPLRSECVPIFPSGFRPHHMEEADNRCLGPLAVNSPRLDMADRCGPCTADCYENCGVWMPSGKEIREVWGDMQRDNRRLD